VEGIFEDDISYWTCEDDNCVIKTDQSFNVPDYLFGEMEEATIKDLLQMYQLPVDSTNDKQNIIR
jgi:hypothetical protein